MTRSDRRFAQFFILALLSAAPLGCKTPGDTVIGRYQGRDIVVTEQEIKERTEAKGLSRTEALRELRREHEMRLALEMQKEWKPLPEVAVEGARIRTEIDHAEAPDEEKMAEMISKVRKERLLARQKALEEELAEGEKKKSGEYGEVGGEGEDEEDDRSDGESGLRDDESDRLPLPKRPTEFELSKKGEGWG